MIRQKNGIWKLTDEEMCTFSCYCSEAKRMYELLNLPALKSEAEEVRAEIFNTLNSVGYYEGV